MRGPRGLLLAAPASGSGKTLVTAGLIAALAARGLRVAAAKSGPDYIDPTFHAAAGAAPCLNLDPWAMRGQTIAALLGTVAADLVLCEGALGLFDGIDAAGTASCGALAARLGWPVVLVVDARGLAASIAALVEGFARHRADVTVAGVIANRVGGARHVDLLRAAVARTGVAFLGAVARAPALVLPERHLGLVPAAEHGATAAIAAARAAVAGVDLDALAALAAPARIGRAAPHAPPPGQRIAVARDAAFAFAYPWMLDCWRAAGAEVTPFSPLADEAPDARADAVFLPGGYPELHAGTLAAADAFRAGLAAAAARGAFVYGECGGYMALGEALIDADGTAHRMAGLLGVTTSFAQRHLHLGYRAASLLAPAPLAAHWRGHEFHYARLVAERGEPLFAVHDAAGAALPRAGLRAGSVMGSFLHLVDVAEAPVRQTPSSRAACD